MDAVGAVFSLLFIVLVVYLISRVAHFMNHTKTRLDKIDRKIDEIKDYITKKES